jgi:hypothetical protein
MRAFIGSYDTKNVVQTKANAAPAGHDDVCASFHEMRNISVQPTTSGHAAAERRQTGVPKQPQVCRNEITRLPEAPLCLPSP